MKQIKHWGFSFLALLSASVFSTERYDPSKNYASGTKVYFNEKIYEAQWWVNPGDSPANITGNSWESPWIFVSNASGDDQASSGDNNSATGGTTPPEPEKPTAPPTPPPVIDGNYPTYTDGIKYKAGDVVQNEGQLYRCKDGVTAAWCSGVSWAYAPGTGSAWNDAWEKVTEADLSNQGKPDTNKPDTSKPDTSNPSPTPPPTNPDDLPTIGPNSTVNINQSLLDQKEAVLTNFPVMNDVKETIRTLDNADVEKIKPNAKTNPENVKRIESIVSESDWNFLFPKRAPEYTYRHFLQATGKFPGFCKTYADGRNSDAICRKALATMFAHFTQETGGHSSHEDVPEWRQGLMHVREMGCNNPGDCGYNGECNPNVWQGQTWPCGTTADGKFKDYFGRGAKQLSYNYNYGPFSEAMFGTVRTLLDNPDMVADTWLNLASAVFFFMYPQPPKPSMMHVIDGTWKPNERDISNNLKPGFGVTTQIINGGVECGGSVEIAQSLNRIKYYKEFANYLGVKVPSDEILGCKGMKSFDAEGAGAVNIYWEKDWSWSADSPSGHAYSCQLVGYQTPYSAFKEGDFTKCVKAHFEDVNIIEEE